MSLIGFLLKQRHMAGRSSSFETGLNRNESKLSAQLGTVSTREFCLQIIWNHDLVSFFVSKEEGRAAVPSLSESLRCVIPL